MINQEELMLAMKNMGIEYCLTSDQVATIIKELDFDGNGEVNYVEFMGATVNI